ncbi:hypothetical protein Atai01_34430 [Amycolatopsis taiwanensis]|uniref:Uncharacterized protein n=1 Tax=Amycolatopsis taiwanensis TaxID=342230 RepID=A0A9W6R0B7_9PSEU|nr:hypothetical protein Atai01_34430 [Amycolatopsis taiwanensis]
MHLSKRLDALGDIGVIPLADAWDKHRPIMSATAWTTRPRLRARTTSTANGNYLANLLFLSTSAASQTVGWVIELGWFRRISRWSRTHSVTCLGSFDVELSVVVDDAGWHTSAVFAAPAQGEDREAWAFLMQLGPSG